MKPNEGNDETYTQAERQRWIADYILENGSVLVDELTERFNVSRMTIHRDLDDLEQQGVLRKIRGGATAHPSSLFESNIRYRLARQVAEKEAMAKLALSHIEPGQAIFLDEATTLLPLVRLLPTVGPLTAITNFLPIIKELSGQKDIRLIGLGGQYLPRFDTFTGPLCLQSVAALHADSYFTSITAVLDLTAYHPDPQIVQVKRAMMARSDRHFILIDHSKFGKAGLYEFASLTEFHEVIVDSGLESGHVNRLLSAGVSLEIAPL